MKMLVFKWFRCFVGSLPPIWGFFLALLGSCLLLASCWPLAGLFLASWFFASFKFRTRISLENRFFKGLPKLVNSLYENACFSMVSVFRGVPPIWGLFLASCWAHASCWPLAVLFLASCRPLGFLLASSFPTRISLENRFFKGLPKLVNSLYENACFSMVSVFRGVPPPHLGPLPSFLLASCLLLASCWHLAVLFLASCWPFGFLLASNFLTRICLENRVFKGLPKLVNSLYENACFSMVSVFHGVPPI